MTGDGTRDWQADVDHGLARIREAQSLEALEALRIEWLGKRGRVTEALRALAQLAPAERREAGRFWNDARERLEEALRTRTEALRRDALRHRLEAERLDMTRPGRQPEFGRLHPVTLVRRRLEEVMLRLGFDLQYGPDVESEWYNFEALNMPAHHPAREMHDTFYLPPPYVLRTHTSPVQIRAMQMAEGRPPVWVATTGFAYRRDDDATHLPQFMQMEGLVVDRGIGMADLKGVVLEIIREVFGAQAQIRLRPSFFPFTEPSAEVDMTCAVCRGRGCRVCKDTGWLEILGSGLVHPHVLRAGGFDPDDVSGFAFGWGIDRVAMLLYGLDDLRLLYQNDLRFLRQF
jgi:phenylalanyl-tRNA synthetase alpha chain